MFHMPGVTPEAKSYPPPAERTVVTEDDLQAARRSLSDSGAEPADFVSLGCPHLTLQEVARIADILRGKRTTIEFWITTSRVVKLAADRLGYSETIEGSGAKFAVDTCCVVAPIRGRFRILATDSAKACYYARAKNQFKTRLLDFDGVVEAALAKPMDSKTGSV
jgi:predicted aconitase